MEDEAVFVAHAIGQAHVAKLCEHSLLPDRLHTLGAFGGSFGSATGKLNWRL